jgi:hypothetical protein
MAAKREPGAWGCNWATLSLEDINTEIWSSRLGLGARLFKIITVGKSNALNAASYIYHDGMDVSGRIF